ncbi:MAG: hypothetical protein CMI09_02455 [Oceanospirillaceae bacterium]|nr:hypothetical protein [Oceanospirillaceae bacterium]
MNTTRIPFLLTTLAVSVMLTACGGDDSDGGSSNNPDSDNAGAGGEQTSWQALQINAASYDDWQYVSLTDGKVLELDAAAAATSTGWHLAFRRTGVKLNGGVSGSGNVLGAVADTQDDFYTDGEADASVFTNADADTEAAALDVAYDTSAMQYTEDTYSTAFSDFYVYNSTTHQISENTDDFWMLRHADGETFSKLTITSLSYGNVALSYVTQASGTVQFAEAESTLNAAFTEGQTRLCLDLDIAAAVDCDTAADSWELMYEVDLSTRTILMWTNGGVEGSGNAGVFGNLASADIASYTSATSSNGQDISRHYSTDSSTSVFTENSWYAYNLSGEHKLWPNFRTYLIDLDSDDSSSAQYTVQIANYYSLGASGSPEIRFQPLNGGN